MSDLTTWLMTDAGLDVAAAGRIVQALFDVPPAERALLVGLDVPVVEITQPLRPQEPWYGASKRVLPSQAPQELKVTLPDYVVTATLMPGTLVYRTRPSEGNQ